jgi:hypothetical protein
MTKFPLGRILLAPGVLALEVDDPKYLKRHHQGDLNPRPHGTGFKSPWFTV